MNAFRWTIGAAVAAAALGPVASRAQPVAEFYKSATVRFVVGYEPGGGMDLYARTIARHIGSHIPGSPKVVIENMPGASSMVASNYVYRVAPQDGTVVLAAGAALPFAPLLGSTAAKFEARNFKWLPSPASETTVLVVWKDAAVKDIGAARDVEAMLATNGPTGTAGFYGRLLNDVLKTKFRLISGYTGGNAEALLAMERREVDGHPGIPWATLKATRSDWLQDGRLRMLVQYGGKPDHEITQVPFARDLIASDEDKTFYDLAVAPLTIGRPYMMGPETPVERYEAIHRAFEATLRDQAFLADAAKSKIDIAPEPMSGDEVRALVQHTYAASPALLKRLNDLAGAPPR